MYLTLEKTPGQLSFFDQALGREHEDIAELVLALDEVLHLDPALSMIALRQ